MVESDSWQRFVRAVAVFCLTAGALVIAANLLSGVAVARSIGRGLIPFLVGMFVLATMARRSRWKAKQDEAAEGKE
jgi:hypothetical protein